MKDKDLNESNFKNDYFLKSSQIYKEALEKYKEISRDIHQQVNINSNNNTVSFNLSTVNQDKLPITESDNMLNYSIFNTDELKSLKIENNIRSKEIKELENNILDISVNNKSDNNLTNSLNLKNKQPNIEISTENEILKSKSDKSLNLKYYNEFIERSIGLRTSPKSSEIEKRTFVYSKSPRSTDSISNLLFSAKVKAVKYDSVSHTKIVENQNKLINQLKVIFADLK